MAKNQYLDITGLTTYDENIKEYIDEKDKSLTTAINGKAASSHSHAIADVTGLQSVLDTKAAQTQVDNITSNYLPLSGGSMNNAATLKLTQYGSRHLTIDGNSLNFDLSNDTGGWAISLANIYDATKTNTTMLGAFGGTSGVNWIYMGGSYDNPHFKITSDGASYFNKTPYVGSTAVSLEGHTHSYNNLTDKPTIPSVGNGTITIKQNGASKGSFTVNQSGNTTIELTDTDTDNNTTYSAGTGLTLSGTTFSLADSGVEADGYGQTGNTSPAFGGNISFPYVLVDAKGRITSAANRMVTLPSTLSNGTGTAGLIKTTSTVTSNSGYTACPVINGVPYYKDTDTKYTHPSHTAKSSGLYKITVDSSGHVSATTAVAKSDITALGIPAQDTTYNLGSFGITATAAELNYCDGVTSNIQTQLNGKAASSHTHDDRYFTESEINTKLASYLSTSGGTISGNLTVTGSTNFNSSCYMKQGVYYNSYEGSTGKCLLGLASTTLNVGHPSTLAHSGDTYLNAVNGSVYLKNKAGAITFNTASGNGYNCVFRPIDANTKPHLGSTSYPWVRVYATNTTISTSDEREKSNIMAISDYPITYSRYGSGNVFEKLFKKLTPKTYTLNAEETDELHIGFIAQDVEQAFEELGLIADDLGFIVHDYWTDEETGEEKDKYGLAYEEFIALNTYIIQKQQDEIELLKERIINLEELANK